MPSHLSDDERLTELEEGIAALVRGEFESRVPIGDGDTVFDAVGTGLNILADELHHTTVGKDYLERIVDAMSDGLLVTSRDGTIDKVNRALLDLTGRSEAELLGQPVAVIVALPEASGAAPTRTKGATVTQEITAALANDQLGPIPVSIKVTPVHDRAGNRHSTLMIVRDLRPELAQKRARQAEIEARAVKAQLKEATKLAAVGQLAAGVAHELNNPLTAVTMFAHYLQDDLASGTPPKDESIPKLRLYIDRILGAAERCKKTIEGLLAFARPGTSELVAVDLGRVVSHVIAMIGHQLRVQDTTLTVAIEGDFVVDAAANQIEQVLLNLIFNAAQALEQGGEIRVTAERRGEETRLCIADSGPGIPKEHLARIFEPFFSTKPVGKGTGLGLAVSWGIMKDHGGEIEVESELGQGSRFTLVFPGRAA
jgi:PAS domain S-box-containing protein